MIKISNWNVAAYLRLSKEDNENIDDIIFRIKPVFNEFWANTLAYLTVPMHNKIRMN